MHEYVEAGGAIDEVAETRPEWTAARFHYDLRLEFQDLRLYLETVLVFENPDDADDPLDQGGGHS
jgi:hypothetical protein